MNEKRFFFVNLKINKVSAILLFGIVAFVAAFYYLTVWPHPIILDDPPFPDGVIATYEETSSRVWYSGNSPNSKTDVWRKEFIVGLKYNEKLNSAKQILAFLDNWLETKGWVRWEEVGDPCANMAEIDFLDRDTGYVPYVPKDTKILIYSPSICVAVWPWTENAYSVLLVTATR